MTVTDERATALGHLRAIDLTDERAIYGVKLLADLGADVIRPIPQEGDALSQRGPHEGKTGKSLWYAFHASSRRLLRVKEAERKGNHLQRLCEHAHLVVVNDNHPFTDCVDLHEVRRVNPSSVIVECSSQGKSGPRKNYVAPDLVAGALGGSVAVTGDADTPPLKPFGDLNFAVSGTYVAVAALSALRHAFETGRGQWVDVSVQECIASSLEHVLMWYWYFERLHNARNRALERRGSLHWTDFYHVMRARNGHIMITPTPSFDNQLAWLIEEEVYDDLLDPEYQEPKSRGRWARRMMDILRQWVVTQDVESLFFESQERHMPYGWVHDIPQVAANPQLEARSWWSTLKPGGSEVKTTGTPYCLSETPATPRDSEEVPICSEDVLEACGWSGRE